MSHFPHNGAAVLGSDSVIDLGTADLAETPSYIDPTDQGVHSGSAIVTVLIINLALGVVLVPLWLLGGRRLKLYQTQGGDPSLWMWHTKAHYGWQVWLKNMWSAVPFEAVTRSYGTDTAVYLAFLKFFSLLGFGMMANSLLIFLPAHLYSLKDNEIDQNGSVGSYEDELFIRTTVQGIEQTPLVMYLHVFGVYLNALLVFWIFERFLEVVKRIFAANNPLETHISSRAIKINQLPARGVSDDDLREHFEGIVPGKVEAVYLAYDVRQRIGYQEKMEHILLRLKYESQSTSSSKAIDVLRKRRAKYIENIREWERYPPTACAGFAHVVFKTPEAKREAMGTKTALIKPSGCKVDIKQAHHPRDINWKEVGRGKTAWALVINIVLCLGLVFFSTPTAIITAFQRATEKIGVFQNLFDKMDDMAQGSFGALVFQYLPVVFYLVLSLILPEVIEWVTRRQPQSSMFGMRQLVMKRLYIYLMLCTFILPSIALSTVSALIYVFQNSAQSGGSKGDDPASTTAGTNPADVNHSLHHLYQGSSTAFFFNLLQVYATVGNYYELWRPLELVKHLKGCVWRRYDPKDSWTWVNEFEFGWQYPLVISSFAITYNYAVFVPLTSLAFFVMCFAKLAIHAHHTRSNTFCRRNALDGQQYGRLIKSLAIMVYLSVVVCTFFSTCFFLFHEEKSQFLPHVGMLLALVAGALYKTASIVRRKKKTFIYDSAHPALRASASDSTAGTPGIRLATIPSSEGGADACLGQSPEHSAATPPSPSAGHRMSVTSSGEDVRSPFTLPMLGDNDSVRHGEVPNTSILRYEGRNHSVFLNVGADDLEAGDIQIGADTEDDYALGETTSGYASISHHLYASPFMPERCPTRNVTLARRHGTADNVSVEVSDGSDKDHHDRSPGGAGGGTGGADKLRTSLFELEPKSSGSSWEGMA